MVNYDDDYTDETYDRYMLTGEGAEYFEETSGDEYIEEPEAEPEEAVEYRELNEQLDDIIRCLKQQIKEQEAMLKAQKKKSAKKK